MSLKKTYCIIHGISACKSYVAKKYVTGKHPLLTLPVKTGQKGSRKRKSLGADIKRNRTSQYCWMDEKAG